MPERDRPRTPHPDGEGKPSRTAVWEDAIERALRKKKPPEGWPDKPKRGQGNSAGIGGGGSGN
jgi:hypothetical protein